MESRPLLLLTPPVRRLEGTGRWEGDSQDRWPQVTTGISHPIGIVLSTESWAKKDQGMFSPQSTFFSSSLNKQRANDTLGERKSTGNVVPIDLCLQDGSVCSWHIPACCYQWAVTVCVPSGLLWFSLPTPTAIQITFWCFMDHLWAVDWIIDWIIPMATDGHLKT